MTQPRFDEAIHPQNRLRICALLAHAEAVDFATVRETLEVSESALSKHVKYLAETGYVQVSKARHGSRNRTWLRLTDSGRNAYQSHLAELQRIAGLSVPTAPQQH